MHRPAPPHAPSPSHHAPRHLPPAASSRWKWRHGASPYALRRGRARERNQRSTTVLLVASSDSSFARGRAATGRSQARRAAPWGSLSLWSLDAPPARARPAQPESPGARDASLVRAGPRSVMAPPRRSPLGHVRVWSASRGGGGGHRSPDRVGASDRPSSWIGLPTYRSVGMDVMPPSRSYATVLRTLQVTNYSIFPKKNIILAKNLVVTPVKLFGYND